ncbi:MAG: hypothetical protein QXY78_05575 [Thermoplasmata archaeon]
MLRPLLVGLADAVQQTTGDPADLNTTATDLVAAINEVLGIANNAGGLNILSGSSNPNENEPVGQELGAFYAQYVNSVLIGFWQYNGVDWVLISQSERGNYYEFACSDEISDLELGIVYEHRLLRDLAGVTRVDFGVVEAPTGSKLEFDVLKNGVSIYTVKPTIDISDFTTLSATVQQSITNGFASFVVGDLLAVEVTQVGSTNAGRNLKAQITYN